MKIDSIPIPPQSLASGRCLSPDSQVSHTSDRLTDQERAAMDCARCVVQSECAEYVDEVTRAGYSVGGVHGANYTDFLNTKK